MVKTLLIQNYGGLIGSNVIRGPEKMSLRPYLTSGDGEAGFSDESYPSLFKGVK
jgi:hypothetical protein